MPVVTQPLGQKMALLAASGAIADWAEPDLRPKAAGGKVSAALELDAQAITMERADLLHQQLCDPVLQKLHTPELLSTHIFCILRYQKITQKRTFQEVLSPDQHLTLA